MFPLKTTTICIYICKCVCMCMYVVCVRCMCTFTSQTTVPLWQHDDTKWNEFHLATQKHNSYILFLFRHQQS